MRNRLKNISRKSAYWLSVAVIGLVIGVSIQFVRAWAPPAGTAPNGDVTAPILTSGSQTINGALAIRGTLTVDNLIVKNSGSGTGNIELGGVNKNAWPQSYEPGTKSDFPVGTTDWVVPYGVNKIHVEVWGAGGGGSIGKRDQSPYVSIMSGGSGASGGYVRADITGLKEKDVIRVTVGGGGQSQKNRDMRDTHTFIEVAGSGNPSSISKIVSGSPVQLIAANGGMGGWGANDYDNRVDYLYCSDRGSFALGGTVSATIPTMNSIAGKNGARCQSVVQGQFCSSGEDGSCYWDPVSLSIGNVVGALGITGLDAGLAYGQGGFGVGWGSALNGVTTLGTDLPANGGDGKVIITY